MEYQNDRFSRFKLGEVVTYHQTTCTYLQCYCRQINMSHASEKMISDQIIQLVDSLFQQFISNKDIQKNWNELEQISLKYISFLSKCCNNSLKAYYMLKILENDKVQRSFYFNNIQKVISIQLEEMMQQESILRKKNLRSMNDAFDQTLSVKSIFQTDMLKEQAVQSLVTFLEQKKQFFSKLSQGHSSLKKYAQDAIKLGEMNYWIKNEIGVIFSEKNKKLLDFNNNVVLLKVTNLFVNILQVFQTLSTHLFSFLILKIQNDFKKLSFSTQSYQFLSISQNIFTIPTDFFQMILILNINSILFTFYLQIQSIYQSVVDKQLWMSMQYEERFKEIMQKNKQRMQNFQETVSYYQENVLVLEVSLIKQKGQITSNNQQRLGVFLGYDIKELRSKKFELSDLMPRGIGSIHDDLMENMIKRGYNKFENQKLSTFARNKAGFIFPVNIKIEVQQGVQDDFRLIASILKLSEKQDEFIMTNEYGWIEGMTEGIYKKMFFQDDSKIGMSNQKLKSFGTLKRMPSLKEGRLGANQVNVFLILQELINNIISHQQEIAKSKVEEQVIHKPVLTKEKVQMRVPLNLSRLNQKINFITKDTQGNQFYPKMQKFLEDISEVIQL